MSKTFFRFRLIAFFTCTLAFLEVTGQRYKMVWSDEFDYKGAPDSLKWDYDVGDGCPVLCGWGNSELQYYTFDRPSNVRVESGYLVIEAHEESFGEARFTSGRLVTRGKREWQYGKIEVRARLPFGAATRPSIWMLPYFEDRAPRLPEDGQIDIMDHNGAETDVVHGMVQTAAYNLSDGTEHMGHIQLTAVDKRFHTFSVEWTPTKIEWFVDGKKFHKAVDDGTGHAGWPFNNPFYLVINLAVSGVSLQDVRNTNWPQKMEVDFVRVYQRKQKGRGQADEFEDDPGY